MARARFLKPTFFTNERVADLAFEERLAWQGLWCQADREGRLKERPRTLKAEIFPFDDVDIIHVLERLSDLGFIQRYSVDGERYIEIPSFLEHQKPHHKEPASILPGPLNHDSAKHESSTIQSRPVINPNDAESMPPESESECITESESESESESGQLPGGDIDPAFGERYRALALAFGERDVDQRMSAEFEQIASDWQDIGLINAAILQCQRVNKRSFPSEVRKYLPPLSAHPATVDPEWRDPAPPMWDPSQDTPERRAALLAEAEARDRERYSPEELAEMERKGEEVRARLAERKAGSR